MNGNATSLPDDELNIRRDYRPDQYTPRPQIQTAHRWFHDRKKQLLTVVALPATGKTWFLRRLQEEFNGNSIVKTLWIEVDDLLSPEMRHGRTREVRDIADIHKHAWFRDFKQQLAAQCPDVAALPYSETDDIAELVEALANEICQNCFAGQQVVLFIDNGDILSNPGWREFERTIIEPFAREKSLRLIVAAREDQKIETFFLKASQQRLILDDLEDEAGEQQMQKLAQEFPMAAPRVAHLLKAIPAYAYSHAGLNTFLYLYADKYPDAQPDRHFLRAMVDVLNRFSEDPDELIELLEAIADYADEWVIEQMAEWQSVSNTEAWERASKLIDNWLVVNISRNRYKIVDGVRDLGVPVIYFVNGGPHLLEEAATAGPDVLGICWRTPLDQAAARVGDGLALQGNLDPHALFAPVEEVRRLAGNVLSRMAGRDGHIMNLGHGILPDTPIASVEALVETVHARTKRDTLAVPAV